MDDESTWNTDINVDSDDDSFDYDKDGYISDSESFDNLLSMMLVYGKRSAIDTIPNGTGLVSYGRTPSPHTCKKEVCPSRPRQINCGFYFQRTLNLVIGCLINAIESDNFNFSLAGVSDPTRFRFG